MASARASLPIIDRSHLSNVVACLVALLLTLAPIQSWGQALPIQPRGASNNISAELVVEEAAAGGRSLDVAIAFRPVDGWHGYWKNPGDAGLGLVLDWDLPPGWTAGEPLYPVPTKLTIAGLMNHVYKGPHTVIVPLSVPQGAELSTAIPIAVDAQWLACTDEICVPEGARLAATVPVGEARPNPRFADWRAAIAPLLDSPALYELSGTTLRVGVPLPATLEIAEPHAFIANKAVGDGFAPIYAGRQTFIREGDMLVAEIPLEEAGAQQDGDTIEGILAFREGSGVRFIATPGDVGLEGVRPIARSQDLPPIWTLLAGALLGGLILNVLPCVFPILSLKALSLARAGGSEGEARLEGVAYTAGAVLACIGLGAALLLLRAGGEQIGWAFQLQEPAVVVALLALASAITANLLGLFELPGLSLESSSSGGAFSTGLLAAFIATPCTGPFMAAALGAALVLPAATALALFAALGLGLALPFLLIGLVPSLRRLLPRPGPWMERFRRWLALPMGLTALALVWLAWRLGGVNLAILGAVMSLVAVLVLTGIGRRFSEGKPALLAMVVWFVAVVATGSILASRVDGPVPEKDASMLDPLAFSEAALSEARQSGRPVFLWFTADWCLTCKVNERVAIERETTREAFAETGVVALRGDWTRRDAAIAAYLERKGAAGVPLYVWIDSDGREEILPQVLTPDMLATRARQSGSGQ